MSAGKITCDFVMIIVTAGPVLWDVTMSNVKTKKGLIIMCGTKHLKIKDIET